MNKPGCCVDREYKTPRGCKPDTCMVLPDGKTCADCVHVRRCVAMFGATETDRWCQFFPRRFRLPVVNVSGND